MYIFCGIINIIWHRDYVFDNSSTESVRLYSLYYQFKITGFIKMEFKFRHWLSLSMFNLLIISVTSSKENNNDKEIHKRRTIMLSTTALLFAETEVRFHKMDLFVHWLHLFDSLLRLFTVLSNILHSSISSTSSMKSKYLSILEFMSLST